MYSLHQSDIKPARVQLILRQEILMITGIVQHMWGGPVRLARQPYGAGNEARTRDLNLGKVALYQLSYSRTIQVPV